MKKSFIAGMATMLAIVLLAGSALALSGNATAEIFYRNIKIVLNDMQIVPKDANGKIVEPFIMDDTTYLPVRAVASATGLDVAWDDPTSTITLTTAKDAGNSIKITFMGSTLGDEITYRASDGNLKLGCTISSSTAVTGVQWYTTNPKYCKISSEGVLSYVGHGDCYIIAVCGNMCKTLKVRCL